MPRILFTETRTTKEAQPQTFEKGRVYDLPPASCDRWKRRGAAVDAPAEELRPKAAKAKAKGGDAPAGGGGGGDTLPGAGGSDTLTGGEAGADAGGNFPDGADPAPGA